MHNHMTIKIYFAKFLSQSTSSAKITGFIVTYDTKYCRLACKTFADMPKLHCNGLNYHVDDQFDDKAGFIVEICPSICHFWGQVVNMLT